MQFDDQLGALIQTFPPPIAQEYKFFCQSQELNSKMNHLCSFVENLFQFLGIASISFYIRHFPEKESVDHFIFCGLERPSLGIWLLLLEKIGAHLSEVEGGEEFIEWRDFLRIYDDERRQLFRFFLEMRNDARHGSASLNKRYFREIETKLGKLTQKISFLSNYRLQKHSEEIGLFHKTSEAMLSLHPFMESDSEKFIFQFPSKKKPEKFFQFWKMEKRFQKYLQIQEGIIEPKTKSAQFRIEQKIDLSPLTFPSKILVNGIPGSGKTDFVFHLEKYMNQNVSILKYFVSESPLKISALIMLKHFLKILTEKSIEDFQNEKFTTQVENLKNFLQKNSHQKFLFAIDGLFSTHTPFLGNERDRWLYFLGQSFPENTILLLTATSGIKVPRFFDHQFTIPPISQEQFQKNFPEKEKFCEEARGNPRILQEILSSEKIYSEKLSLYFKKLFRELKIYKAWQKKALYHMISYKDFLSVKELAAKVEKFTPQVEKFLQGTMPLLEKRKNLYRIQIPILKYYVKDLGLAE